ncbi:PAS domain S-box-containing protein [Pontibacter ummariensis]|uniref:histidine kinase n=1 Tax=Pontibacter ummariensis TaxID=1610492 RepID=A0A239J2W9_9BACT|nr:ATP-binding protein [Pontibacter ummariensis]PRY08853.1 PAS domain S-box-containing protein [Pontibacter ummariensis]SNT00135.1 PAS domain S-box-containing protein [Pontibacter ummariensis]
MELQHEESVQQDLLQQLKETQRKLEERNRQLELINQVGSMLTSELELDKVVQSVTDIATKISSAKFGALFYKKFNEKGEEFTLYALSGANREDFAHLPVIRHTPILEPTLTGERIIRSDDITKDPRYGQNRPHHGMPKGHLPVRSYMAIPVVTKSGSVIGGLFFGHPEPGVFSEKEEELVSNIARQAAVAIDNARLFEAKQQAEQRVRLVIESIPQMAWTSLPDGALDFFNKRWQEYTGQSVEESRGHGWQEVVHPDDLPKTLEAWQNSLNQQEVFKTEHRIRRGHDGVYHWHLSRAVPVQDEEGKLAWWVGTSTDIDDQIQAQKSLLEKNKELVKINEDLDNFVYIASHDLKAPVLNIAELVKELHSSAALETGDEQMLFSYLNKSIYKLNRTIQDLSDVARSQKGIEAPVERLTLQEILEEVQFGLKSVIAETEAVILTKLEKAPVIPFSRVNLKSVLFNLVSNSLKYRFPGRSPIIEVSSSVEPDYFVISVSDNGLGMDLEAQRSKLFQMFRRFHDHVPGSGVGLYIVNRIIKNQGGYIEVNSKVGEGTTFTLFIKRGPVALP